jgi:anti-anti-sigma factor
LSRENEKEERGLFILKEISRDEVELLPEGGLGNDDMTEFQSWLDQTLKGGHRVIALNLKGVSTVGSSAIGKILHFKQLCDEMGRRLLIRKCNPEMRQLLKMIKFDDLIPIEE